MQIIIIMFFFLLFLEEHRRTGPVSFRGAEVSCPNNFLIACPKIKWFSPNITDFLPENGYLKISMGGGGGGSLSLPPPPTSYAYVEEYLTRNMYFAEIL